MFNFYEQPWTLVGIAIIVLFVIFTYRSVVPEKKRWWQLLIPLLIVAAAFGIDSLVQTDKERIDAVIDAGIKAVRDENFNAIESHISDDYRDSFHRSKRQLIEHVQRELPRNVVERSKKTDSIIKVSDNRAKVNLFMQIVLNQNSDYSQIYNGPLNLKIDIDFIKQNNDWLINSIELRSVNMQSIRWNDIR